MFNFNTSGQEKPKPTPIKTSVDYDYYKHEPDVNLHCNNKITATGLKNMKVGEDVCFGLRIHKIENLTLKMRDEDKDHIDLYMGDHVEVTVEIPENVEYKEYMYGNKFEKVMVSSAEGVPVQVDNKFITSGIFYIAPYFAHKLVGKRPENLAPGGSCLLEVVGDVKGYTIAPLFFSSKERKGMNQFKDSQKEYLLTKLYPTLPELLRLPGAKVEIRNLDFQKSFFDEVVEDITKNVPDPSKDERERESGNDMKSLSKDFVINTFKEVRKIRVNEVQVMDVHEGRGVEMKTFKSGDGSGDEEKAQDVQTPWEKGFAAWRAQEWQEGKKEGDLRNEGGLPDSQALRFRDKQPCPTAPCQRSSSEAQI